MDSVKRLRVFAGPNGSGKTTLYEIVSKNCDLGTFVNADFIEKELRDSMKLDFSSFNLSLSNQLFSDRFKTSSFFAPSNGYSLLKDLYFEGNSICLNNIVFLNSYFAALMLL